MSNAPDEPTDAEASTLAELFSTTRRQSNLAILRAHVAAEVAKATAEDTELLNWLASRYWKFREETEDTVACREFTLCMKPGVPKCPVDLRAAIRAARAQQKDT